MPLVTKPKTWIIVFRLLRIVKIWNKLARQLWSPNLIWLIDEQATLALVIFTVLKVKLSCQKLLVCNASHTWPYLATNLSQFDPSMIGTKFRGISYETFETILFCPGDPFQFMQGLGGSGATSLATSPSGALKSPRNSVLMLSCVRLAAWCAW